MEKRVEQNEYSQRNQQKKQFNASNNEEEQYKNSCDKGIDSVHASLSRHEPPLSLSSDTLDIFELAPSSQQDDTTLTSQSGLGATEELPQKLVESSNELLPNKEWEISQEQHRLPPRPLVASTRKNMLPLRESQKFRTSPARLTSCSKLLHVSSKTSNYPRPRQLRIPSHGINSSPSRYTNSAESISKSVPTSPKTHRNRLTSPRPSKKSSLPKPLNYPSGKSSLIPKVNEKYIKGNTHRLSAFNRMSSISSDSYERQASFESPPTNKNLQVAVIQQPPAQLLFKNLSYNSLKTFKCVGHVSASSKASRFPTGGVGIRSKPPIVQRPQFLKRGGSSSKRSYPFCKTNRNSQMTAARRRMRSLEINPTKSSFSDNLESFSAQRKQKVHKEHHVPVDTILHYNTTAKPPHAAMPSQIKTNNYNRGLGQKKAKGMLARPETATNYQQESPKENVTSLSVSPKRRKFSRTPPKSYLCKYSPSRAKKATHVREPRAVSSKNLIPYAGHRTRNFLRSIVRPKPREASKLKPHVRSNSLEVYGAQNVQQSTQNLRKTSILFQFQTKRWMLEPSNGSEVQCKHETDSNRESQDCFAAWELTQHEVLQSCRSDDLLIMNNAVSQSSPHSHSRKFCATKWKKNKAPQPDISLDNQKSGSIRQETRVYAINAIHPVLSISVRSAQSISNMERKSHSEYTSSTDISSVTSRWSLCSSVYSNFSPKKSQKSSNWSMKPDIQSWSCIQSVPNQRKPQKQRDYQVRPSSDMENKKQTFLKYPLFNQSRRSSALKAHHRGQQRVLKSSCFISKKSNNKQGRQYARENTVKKQRRFLDSSSYDQELQTENTQQPSLNQTLHTGNEPFRGKISVPVGEFSSYAVESGVVPTEQVLSDGSSSTETQKQTLSLSTCPENKPKKDTSSTPLRFVRKETRKSISDAKKCVLGTQRPLKTPLSVWKWRLLTITCLLLLATSHYLAYLIAVSSA